MREWEGWNFSELWCRLFGHSRQTVDRWVPYSRYDIQTGRYIPDGGKWHQDCARCGRPVGIEGRRVL